MNQLTKQQKCLCLRNGAEIWLDTDRAEKLITLLSDEGGPKMFEYEGRLINRADIVAVLLPQDMRAKSDRRRGVWTCDYGTKHEPRQKCACHLK